MTYAAIFQGRVAEEHLDAVRQALTKLANDSMHEPGASRYEFYQQWDDPTMFLLFAIWENEADWKAHVAGDAHEEYVASLPDGAWVKPPDMTRLEPLD